MNYPLPTKATREKDSQRRDESNEMMLIYISHWNY